MIKNLVGVRGVFKAYKYTLLLSLSLIYLETNPITSSFKLASLSSVKLKPVILVKRLKAKGFSQ